MTDGGGGSEGLERPARPQRFETTSGIEIKPLYTSADTAHLDEATDLGRPGESPFTRGIHPTMYRGRLWTMRQYAGFATAEETNRRFRYLLDRGQTGLSVAFDLPTQMGYDSDAPAAAGEVGRVGVPISSIEDMDRLLDRDPARPGEHLDDDQRDGGHPPRPLRRRRRRSAASSGPT